MSSTPANVPINGLFETHLTVKDLARSVVFYRDVLGMELAYRLNKPALAFFWIGQPGQAMLGLWDAGGSPNVMRLHTAFACSLDEVLAAPAKLKAAGIAPRDFVGEPCDEPVVIGWMPAVSVYFHDPDGHLLEYIAMLDEPPRPELGIIPQSQWRQRTAKLQD